MHNYTVYGNKSRQEVLRRIEYVIEQREKEVAQSTEKKATQAGQKEGA